MDFQLTDLLRLSEVFLLCRAFRFASSEKLVIHAYSATCDIGDAPSLVHTVNLPLGCYRAPVSPGAIRLLTISCQSSTLAGPARPTNIVFVCVSVCVVKQ